jgi:hypothetical protein
MKKVKTTLLVILVATSSYLIGNDKGQEQKKTQILNKLDDHGMEWYQWQDVEKIVNDESINGY